MSKKKLNDEEIKLIKKYNATDRNIGYNIEEGGNSMPRSEETIRKLKRRIVSAETRQKISKAHKGRIISEEQRKQISKTLMGRKRPPFSEEHKKNISKARTGIIFSEGHKRNLSRAKKGMSLTMKTRQKMKEGQKRRRLREMVSLLPNHKHSSESDP